MSAVHQDTRRTPSPLHSLVSVFAILWVSLKARTAEKAVGWLWLLVQAEVAAETRVGAVVEAMALGVVIVDAEAVPRVALPLRRVEHAVQPHSPLGAGNTTAGAESRQQSRDKRPEGPVQECQRAMDPARTPAGSSPTPRQ